jgi:hypothetical protein
VKENKNKGEGKKKRRMREREGGGGGRKPEYSEKGERDWRRKSRD